MLIILGEESQGCALGGRGPGSSQPSCGRIPSRCRGKALRVSQPRPVHGHRAREGYGFSIPGGSTSPAAFAASKSPRQCMVSIGDSKGHVLL